MATLDEIKKARTQLNSFVQAYGGDDGGAAATAAFMRQYPEAYALAQQQPDYSGGSEWASIAGRSMIPVISQNAEWDGVVDPYRSTQTAVVQNPDGTVSRYTYSPMLGIQNTGSFDSYDALMKDAGSMGFLDKYGPALIAAGFGAGLTGMLPGTESIFGSGVGATPIDPSNFMYGAETTAGAAAPSLGGTGSLFPNFGGAAYNPATSSIADIVQAVSASGGNAIPAGMLTPELAAAAASGTSLAAASPGVLSSLANLVNGSLGTNLSGSQLLSGGLSAIGGLLSGNAAQDAAQTSANAQLEAARIAAEAAKFKPVGVTTNFGQSTFQKDAQGNVIGAGYTLSPQLKALQDQLMGAAPGMLNQFTGSQATTAPMGTAAQTAMNLGNQYLATSPQAQAQKYYDEQQAVMAAQRERDRVNLENRLMAQGRLGLATGGTSTGMMAANPEMEALYNAQRQQDLQLAAAATQGGMDYAKFGAGMVGTGGDLLKSMYGTQTAAFDPYKTALGGAQTIEGLGQNALDLSINLGKVASPAQSGQLLAQGMVNAANTQQAAAYSPWGTAMMNYGNMLQNFQTQQQAQQQQQQLVDAIRQWGNQRGY